MAISSYLLLILVKKNENTPRTVFGKSSLKES